MPHPHPVRLFGYFRSGAAWRVRIGLAWKGIEVAQTAIDLRTGAQTAPEWRARNPQGMVPALELSDGTLITQSLAILEWLEEAYPADPFLPADPITRARIRAACLVVAADTHPIQNLGILKRVEALTDADGAKTWANETITRGLTAFEALIAREPGPFCFGATPTLADIILIPMLGNARRFGVDLAGFPRIAEAETACAPFPAFQSARPEAQPDAD
jgi:maleylpyruvate isomerase